MSIKLPKHDYILNNYPKLKKDREILLKKKEVELKNRVNIINHRKLGINLKKLLK